MKGNGYEKTFKKNLRPDSHYSSGSNCLYCGHLFLQAEKYRHRKESIWITLEEFDDCIHGKGQKDTFYIYVGRDDCPDCEEFSPKLQSIIKEEELSVLYYSTSQDREKHPDEMYALLDEAKVTEVPVVLEVVNGKISASYTGEEFLALYEK